MIVSFLRKCLLVKRDDEKIQNDINGTSNNGGTDIRHGWIL